MAVSCASRVCASTAGCSNPSLVEAVVAVALADPLAQSPTETRTRLALVLHGLPPPVSQFEVRGAGRCLHRPWHVAVDVDRELERAAERLGLPMIPASVAVWQ